MPKNHSISVSLAANAGKLCNVSTCERTRHKLSRFCRVHDDRRQRWGSVHGHVWRAGNIKQHRPNAEAFLALQLEHPAIITAERFLRDMMDSSYKTLHVDRRACTPCTKAWSALRQADVSAHEILVRAISVTLYMLSLPKADQAMDTYVRQLGNDILRLVKPRIARGSKQTKYSIAIGGTIWGSLKSLLVGIIVHVQQAERAQADFDAAAKIPFRSA